MPRGRCEHQSQMTVSPNRNARGWSILLSSIPLQGMSRGRCEHQSQMTVPLNRNARGGSILPSLIPLQGMSRGRREHQSKMTVPHNKEARGMSIPSTPRCTADSFAPGARKRFKKNGPGDVTINPSAESPGGDVNINPKCRAQRPKNADTKSSKSSH